MAENYDLIFGQSASQQYGWSDSDYQNGWQTVGSTPPTAEQFDALQRRSDTKAKDLNDRLSPLETKAEADGRQAATSYTSGAMLTVDGLPNGWLLECIAPGISGTDAITLPDTLIDGLAIIDGNVTWALRKVATYGGLGYRQPSTAYTAGQVKYHPSLPTGWYLECTTAGTTGSGALTISTTSIGTTVSDGTVVWTISRDLPISGGTMTGDLIISANKIIKAKDNTNMLTLQGGENVGATLQLFGHERSGQSGEAHLNAWGNPNVVNNYSRLVLKPNGDLTHSVRLSDSSIAVRDLGGSAIVAKSLGANGYIKYQSGLIIQYGSALVGSTLTQIDFPISFTHDYSITADYEWSAPVKTSFWAKTLSSVKLMNDTGTLNANWFAIGY